MGFLSNNEVGEREMRGMGLTVPACRRSLSQQSCLRGPHARLRSRSGVSCSSHLCGCCSDPLLVTADVQRQLMEDSQLTSCAMSVSREPANVELASVLFSFLGGIVNDKSKVAHKTVMGVIRTEEV